MKKRDMWEIYRRWKDSQAISHIAAGERRDRKTIRQYVEGFVQLGLKPEAPAMSEQDFSRLVGGMLPARNERPAPGSDQLIPYRDELREMINHDKDC